MTEENKKTVEWIKKQLWKTGTDLDGEELSDWNHNYYEAIKLLDALSKENNK